MVKDSERYRSSYCLAPAPEQRELARQYAFLWMQTEPESLPTHYYRTLSMKADFDEQLILQDKQIEAERQELRKAILKIIVSYFKATTNDEGQ